MTRYCVLKCDWNDKVLFYKNPKCIRNTRRNIDVRNTLFSILCKVYNNVTVSAYMYYKVLVRIHGLSVVHTTLLLNFINLYKVTLAIKYDRSATRTLSILHLYELLFSTPFHTELWQNVIMAIPDPSFAICHLNTDFGRIGENSSVVSSNEVKIHKGI